MSAREILATTYIEGHNRPIGHLHAKAIEVALTAAGFSIVHKDEIHAPSVERCAAWHELQANVLEGQCEAITKDGGWPDRAREADARLHRRSAAALRELMKEVGRG